MNYKFTECRLCVMNCVVRNPARLFSKQCNKQQSLLRVLLVFYGFVSTCGFFDVAY